MNWLSKLTTGLKKTSSQLGEGITSVFTTRKLDAATLEALEEVLIMADMGAKPAVEIIATLAENRVNKEYDDAEIRSALAQIITARLQPFALPLDTSAHSPCIVVMVGVNGNGKTTTIGKLAHRYTQDGKRVVLVAADTFRAAAVGQLQEWAVRAGVPCIPGAEGADPASVVYQGVEAAIKERADIVLIDTAGRLHTKTHLMEELSKIIKTIKKLLPDAPHHVLQVLDATTGQNAIAQAKAFKEVAGVTGLIVSKLDGTAKAGVVVALCAEIGLPIHLIGVGEGSEDLQAFDASSFAQALVGPA
jgi:fused signal recognition particle receptor